MSSAQVRPGPEMLQTYSPQVLKAHLCPQGGWPRSQVPSQEGGKALPTVQWPQSPQPAVPSRLALPPSPALPPGRPAAPALHAALGGASKGLLGTHGLGSRPRAGQEGCRKGRCSLAASPDSPGPRSATHRSHHLPASLAAAAWCTQPRQPPAPAHATPGFCLGAACPAAADVRALVAERPRTRLCPRQAGQAKYPPAHMEKHHLAESRIVQMSMG